MASEGGAPASLTDGLNRPMNTWFHSLGQPLKTLGPDGAVYALTDKGDGEILRLTPASPRS